MLTSGGYRGGSYCRITSREVILLALSPRAEPTFRLLTRITAMIAPALSLAGSRGSGRTGRQTSERQFEISADIRT